MSKFEITGDYSSLSLDDEDQITLKSKSTHFLSVSFTPDDLESLRFRKAAENQPGYISFHMNDGRVLLGRFGEAEKNQYRQFFLAVRDVLLSDIDEAAGTEASESTPDMAETKTVLMPNLNAAGEPIINAPSSIAQAEEETVTETTVQPEETEQPEAEPEEQEVEEAPAEEPEDTPEETQSDEDYAVDEDEPAEESEPEAEEPDEPEEPSGSRHHMNLMILFAFILGLVYSVFLIAYYGGFSGDLITKYSTLGDYMSFNRSFISPHALCAVFATVFAGLALLKDQPWCALASSVLYFASAAVFPPYVFFVIIEAVFCLIGFFQLKKVKQRESKNFKLHWIYAMDAMLGALAAVALVCMLASSFLDSRTSNKAYATASASASAVSETAAPSQETANPSSTAAGTDNLDEYSRITLGDTANSGEGGTTYASVSAFLGTPVSKVDSSTADVSNISYTWYDSMLGENASYTITFINDMAVNKSYAGFSSLNTDTVITADQYNAVATDGTLSYDQAVSQFGQPDSESESLIDGTDSRYVSWTNTETAGASISITFTNNMATDKSSYGL